MSSDEDDESAINNAALDQICQNHETNEKIKEFNNNNSLTLSDALINRN